MVGGKRMETSRIPRKWFSIVVTFCVIALAAAPGSTIQAATLSSNDQTVEFTVSHTGLSTATQSKVRCTAQQAAEVERLFDTTKTRLDAATSAEQTKAILNETVAALHPYGLLGDLSIAQAQRLISNPLASRARPSHLHNTSRFLQDVNNHLCIVTGSVTNSFLIGPISLTCFTAWLLLMDLVYFIGVFLESFGLFIPLLDLIFNTILGLLETFWNSVPNIPLEIGGSITLGSVWYEHEVGPNYTPSQGWIDTYGLAGHQTMQGPFYGSIREKIFPPTFVAVAGFTGLVIGSWETGHLYFLGTALKTGTSSTPME
jgi:hypothetical protein